MLTTVLDFSPGHQVLQQVECFPTSCVDDVLDHPVSGKVRYRVVLHADF